jgi:hypothetical protein
MCGARGRIPAPRAQVSGRRSPNEDQADAAAPRWVHVESSGPLLTRAETAEAVWQHAVMNMKDDVMRGDEAGSRLVDVEPWPLWALPLETFLSLDSLAPHEELLYRLRVASESDIVIFVSHQWSSTTRPDTSAATKLRTVQAVLRDLAAGRVREAFASAEECASAGAVLEELRVRLGLSSQHALHDASAASWDDGAWAQHMSDLFRDAVSRCVVWWDWHAAARLAQRPFSTRASTLRAPNGRLTTARACVRACLPACVPACVWVLA